MSRTEETWYDEDAGPLVRRYARAGRRDPAPPDGLELSTIVQRVPGLPEPDTLTADQLAALGTAGVLAAVPSALSDDQLAALRLVAEPIALSEVAAHLGLPLGSTRLLIGGLRDAGLIETRRRNTSPDVLERLLSGLNSL